MPETIKQLFFLHGTDKLIPVTLTIPDEMYLFKRNPVFFEYGKTIMILVLDSGTRFQGA